ncbi:MAG: hypothetical protein JOZ81_09170 [Chloroflexi bacterium]|nr:hypothetical protein [Chloroflexota bacterium]MBV9547338.1 hypothetical protein [Chloroflexota bacterium]
MLYTPGIEQLDPALLAFVKCHITSPLKWEALRVLESHNGEWVREADLARATHRPPLELASAMAELAAEGVIEVSRSGEPGETRYCLPANDPTSVVAHRLIETATHNQELRGVIAAYLARSRAAPSHAPRAAA